MSLLIPFLIAIPPAAIFAFIFEKKRRERVQRVEQNITGDQNSQYAAGRDIVVNPEPPRQRSRAEITADTFRKYLRQNAVVFNADNSGWGAAEIVEVSEDDVITLFVPSSYNSSSAFAVRVKCEDAEITEMAQGNCPIRVRVMKRYGPDIQLGDCKRWEDRNKATGEDAGFVKGDCPVNASYSKQGSSDRTAVYIYVSKDGRNWFQLETASGQVFYGNNVDISKRFMSLQIDLYVAGFNRSTFGQSGGVAHRLYVA